MRNTPENQPKIIILAPANGKPKKVTGKQYEIIAEAITIAMEQVDAEERERTGKSIRKTIADEKGVYVIDRYAPESFSYIETALVALFAGGRKKAKEIAEFIVEKRLRKRPQRK